MEVHSGTFRSIPVSKRTSKLALHGVKRGSCRTATKFFSSVTLKLKLNSLAYKLFLFCFSKSLPFVKVNYLRSNLKSKLKHFLRKKSIAPDKDWRQLGIYPPLFGLIGYFKI